MFPIAPPLVVYADYRSIRCKMETCTSLGLLLAAFPLHTIIVYIFCSACQELFEPFLSATASWKTDRTMQFALFEQVRMIFSVPRRPEFFLDFPEKRVTNCAPETLLEHNPRVNWRVSVVLLSS
jgi:hypothetical protein